MPEPAAIGVRIGQAERLEPDARAESRRYPGGRKGGTKWTRNWAGANSWER